MKIACIYWPTSSVGGIATNVASLRAEAKKRGHTFHTFVSANAKTHLFRVYDTLDRIRGGDTYIDINGYASHHEHRYKYSAQRLNEYDIIYLAFLCPHPTKAYGGEPQFFKLLALLNRPIVGHITDGYFDTYEEWGIMSATRCARIVVDQEAYIPDSIKLMDKPYVVGRSFDPQGLGMLPGDPERDEQRSLTWIAQWKAIKGIHKFLELLPMINCKQELYSNGILYYQLRTEESWKRAVAQDLFARFNGDGRAIFYGWKPTTEIRSALRRAWFMPEFQGLGNPRNAAYKKGTLNHTIVEALYEGCTPVIPQITIDALGIPSEAAYGVKDYKDCVAILNESPMAPKSNLGKNWVMDNFDPSRTYDKFFGGLV